MAYEETVKQSFGAQNIEELVLVFSFSYTT